MIGLGTAATQLDTAVNIAFPAITRGFGLAIGDIQWVVISYVLTYASLLLALGRIGDTVGHALVFRIGLIWSAVALLLVSCVAELRRDAGLSLPAGCRRGTGAELWRGAGDIALWRGAAQPGARHLHHDAGARPDARSPAWRRPDGGLGLARGLLVPHSHRDCGAVAVARHAGIAAAPVRRSLRSPWGHRAGAGPGDHADGAQSSSRVLRRSGSDCCPPLAFAAFISASHGLRARSLPSMFSGGRVSRCSISSACWPISPPFRSGCWCPISWRASPAIR